MRQKELIKKFMQQTASTKAASEQALKALACIAVAELSAGGEVPLPGLGKLVVEDRAARRGRNPMTGAPLDIPARRVLRLRPDQAVKDALA